MASENLGSPKDPVDEELSDALPSDGRIKNVTSNLMPTLKKAVTDLRGGSEPSAVNPVEYKIQEDPCSFDMDTNYFVKIQVGDDEFVHAKIAQDSQRRLSLCKLAPKSADDEIENNF